MEEAVKLTRRQKLAKEGRCVDCGKFSYPYYKCYKHRVADNVRRVLNQFEKLELVEVRRDPKDKKKIYKWKGKDAAFRKYSPEAVAKMSLPRLKGKPMTGDLIQKCILEVLDKHQVPLSEREIATGIKQMKTLDTIITPDKVSLLNEYHLIKAKRSNLSSSQRRAVEFRVNFLQKRGIITENELL